MTNAKKIKIIDKALALIGGPEGAKRWCKYTEAMTKDGEWLSDSKSRKAVKWCAVGALEKYGFTNAEFEELRKFQGEFTTTINDKEGRGAVLRALKRFRKHLETRVALSESWEALKDA